MPESLPGLRHFKSYIHGSQVFNAASAAMLILTMLGGVSSGPPLGWTYFLQADTSGIDGAKNRTRWTFFQICGVDDDGMSSGCDGIKMAPLGAWSGDASGIPRRLQGPADGGRIRGDLYGIWTAAWWMILVVTILLLLKLADSLAHNQYSGTHIEVGRIVRYAPILLLTPAMIMFLYSWLALQAGFGSDSRTSNVGSAGFGFVIGAWASLVVCELILWQLRNLFSREYERMQAMG